ncbi:MAG: Serine/threonine-protein phosphatase [Aureobasidium pullulans]|nr:MAG: Serine/threonine-protein phosphatase [Aureobasidium pullulans]
MKRGIAALASLASLVSAQSINITGIPVATPTGVFNLPVVYATAGQPAVTATTLAVSATASSDPSATSLIDAAARASVGASSVQRRRMRKRDGTCAPQPSGITHQSSPDTPAGFVADPYYAQAANNAAAPAGYTAMFTNLNASNSANQYMGYTLLPSYDVQSCASKCSAITGCNSVNIYFERDPTLDPNAINCPNPASTINVKCVFWGDVVGLVNANNYGQWRNSFQVLIAGSNGYVSNALLPKPTSSSSAVPTSSATSTSSTIVSSSSSAISSAAAPTLSILSAFFGQQDVTSLAQTKLKSGNGYYLDTFNLVPTLGVDPWVGNPKLITLLYMNGTTLRTFAISEAEGRDSLFPTYTNCDGWNCVGNAVTVAPPANSPIKLVSVVYGDKQITQKSVYTYIYNQAISKTTMNVGSWLFGYNPVLITRPGYKASCVIWYYSAADDYQTLRAFTGKDNVAADGDRFAWNGSDFALV